MSVTKTELQKIASAYRAGYLDAKIDDYQSKNAVDCGGEYYAYMAGVNDFKAGYKLDLTVFNEEIKMEIKDIKNWFEVAKPNPTLSDACVQIGCHYEEVAEMAVAISDDETYELMCEAAEHFKNLNAHMGWLSASRKVELLDALCDQIVTAIGVAHMLGMDIEGALDEVNKSNHSKFEGGKAVLDGNGKIRKGKDYFPPDLTEFI